MSSMYADIFSVLFYTCWSLSFFAMLVFHHHRRRRLVFFCSMSHHFDGTSFSLCTYTQCLHVKQVKIWHTSHNLKKRENIRYNVFTHAPDPYFIIAFAFFYVCLFLQMLTCFHSLRRLVLWCNSKKRNQQNSAQTKTQHNFVYADWVSENFSQWHRLRMCQIKMWSNERQRAPTTSQWVWKRKKDKKDGQ